MLPEEVLAGDEEGAAAARQKLLQNEKRRHVEASRAKAILGRDPLLNIDLRTPLWLGPGVSPRDLEPTFSSRSLVLEPERSSSRLFVVSCPSSPGPAVLLSAALHGGRIADSEFVSSSGRRGVGLKYDSAIRSKRAVWLSARFQEKHPVLASLVQSAAKSTGSRWRLLGTRAAYINRVVAATRENRPFRVLGLVTSRDIAEVPVFPA